MCQCFLGAKAPLLLGCMGPRLLGEPPPSAWKRTTSCCSQSICLTTLCRSHEPSLSSQQLPLSTLVCILSSSSLSPCSSLAEFNNHQLLLSIDQTRLRFELDVICGQTLFSVRSLFTWSPVPLGSGFGLIPNFLINRNFFAP